MALHAVPAANEWLRERPGAETTALHTELVEVPDFSEIVGRSPALRRAVEKLRQVADTCTPVLLLGETGTGKELLARALHAPSPRRARPFIAVNCAALPATLIESELFGHEKGAFTGATQARPGRFELANQGTLLLDEIGRLEPTFRLLDGAVIATRDALNDAYYGKDVTPSDVLIRGAEHQPNSAGLNETLNKAATK